MVNCLMGSTQLLAPHLTLTGDKDAASERSPRLSSLTSLVHSGHVTLLSLCRCPELRLCFLFVETGNHEAKADLELGSVD